MVGCGLERGSNDTLECRVVSELRAKTVLALFPPSRSDEDTSSHLLYRQVIVPHVKFTISDALLWNTDLHSSTLHPCQVC